MKAKELEVLAEAVRTENLRREALNAQARFASRFLDLRRLMTVQSLSSLNRGQGLVNYRPAGAEMERNKEGLDWVRIAERVRRNGMSPSSGPDSFSNPGIRSLFHYSDPTRMSDSLAW